MCGGSVPQAGRKFTHLSRRGDRSCDWGFRPGVLGDRGPPWNTAQHEILWIGGLRGSTRPLGHQNAGPSGQVFQDPPAGPRRVPLDQGQQGGRLLGRKLAQQSPAGNQPAGGL